MSLLEIFAIIQSYISRYGWPIIFTFASIGCLLNICLFSRRSFRTIPCCLYFLSASITMLIALCIGIIPLFQPLINSYSYNRIRNFCKIRSYFIQTSSMMYRWFMAIACIDRFVHTSSDISRQQMLNIRLTYRIIAIVVIIWLILPIHQAIWSDIQANVCVIANTTVDIYNSFFTIIAGALLPILIMLVFALLIHRNLEKKRQLRLRMQRTTTQHKEQNRQVLVMLSVQVSVYTISILPWTAYMIYAAFTRQQIKSTFEVAIESYIKYFIQVMVYIYPVLSFYMYTLTSRTFRQELIKMFKSIWFCQYQCLFLTHRIRPLTA